MRCWCRSRLASSGLTPSRTVTSLSLVISSATFWRGSAAKRTSRLVRMPTSLPAPLPLGDSTTGTPEMRCRSISVERIGQRGVRADGDRIDHHAAFEALDPAHLLGLFLDAQILVNHAHAAGLGHGDGQARLRSPCPWRRRSAECPVRPSWSGGCGYRPGREELRRRRAPAGHRRRSGLRGWSGCWACAQAAPSWSAEPVPAVP